MTLGGAVTEIQLPPSPFLDTIQGPSLMSLTMVILSVLCTSVSLCTQVCWNDRKRQMPDRILAAAMEWMCEKGAQEDTKGLCWDCTMPVHRTILFPKVWGMGAPRRGLIKFS